MARPVGHDHEYEYRIYRTPTGWALACWDTWPTKSLGWVATMCWRRYYKDRDKAKASLERSLEGKLTLSQWTDERGTTVRMAA